MVVGQKQSSRKEQSFFELLQVRVSFVDQLAISEFRKQNKFRTSKGTPDLERLPEQKY